MNASGDSSPASRSLEWERLRTLLLKVGRGGVERLDEEELWELPSLYRKTLSDLSLMRSAGASAALQEELERLCNRAHGLIYSHTRKRSGSGALQYIAAELPRAVRRRWTYILGATLTMLLFSAIGYVHAARNSSLAEVVLGPNLLGSMRSSIEAARQEADLGLAAQIPREQRSAMALAITLNNIGVAVRAFVFGIAMGLITIIIIAFNGYMLGAVAHTYFHSPAGVDVNLPMYFWAGIAPHGFIELSAISLSAASGMLLGCSWMFPGGMGRGEALRKAVPDALRIATACALTLLVAGAIEGFVTPLERPGATPVDIWYWGKIAFGALIWLAWLTWLCQGGRRLEVAKAA